MSEEIDMKAFSGELLDSAAEGQQMGSNSYQQATQAEEYPVHEEFLDKQQVSQEALQEQPSKQELNFKALREEVDRIKAEREAERRDYQQNVELMRANLMAQQAPVQQAKSSQSNKMFDGMEDHEVPNVSEIRKAWEQREVDYQSRIEELQVAQTHPDYAEVLEKYLTPLIKQKPHLAQGIHGAQNKALFAYELGKMYQQQQQAAQQPNTPSVNAQRMVENSRKPGTLSSAGGQGALSKADYYASMSDADFMKVAARHLGEI